MPEQNKTKILNTLSGGEIDRLEDGERLLLRFGNLPNQMYAARMKRSGGVFEIVVPGMGKLFDSHLSRHSPRTITRFATGKQLTHVLRKKRYGIGD